MSSHTSFCYVTENDSAAVSVLLISPAGCRSAAVRGHFGSSAHSETAFSRKAFSFTNSILHAGRLVAEPLEKGQAHVLLHPVPKFQHAENLLLGRKGKKIFPPPPALLTACCVWSRRSVVLSEISDISG